MYSEDAVTDEFASLEDLIQIRALVTNKHISPKLLNHGNVLRPFDSSIKVIVHPDAKTGHSNEQIDELLRHCYNLTCIPERIIHSIVCYLSQIYEVLYWNGASPNQCSCFQITKLSTQKTRFYQYFDASPPNIVWHVDTFSGLSINIEGSVAAEVEASFQANLEHNFCESSLPCKQYFNCSRLTICNKKNAKDPDSEIHALRCYFEEAAEGHEKLYRCDHCWLGSQFGSFLLTKIWRWNLATGKEDLCQTEEI